MKIKEETLKNMTEAEIKANLEAQNKSAIENILKRKNREDVYGLEDYDTTNMSEIKKEIIRTETKLGNLNPNSPDFRERAKPLIDKILSLEDASWNENLQRQETFDVHKKTSSLVMIFCDGWPEINISKEQGWDHMADLAIPLISSQ